MTTDLIVPRIPKESKFAGANCHVIVRFTLGVASAEDQVAGLLTLCLTNIVLDALFVVGTVVVGHATQFLHTDIIVAVLILGTAGVALARRLAKTVDAKLVTYAVSRATTERYIEIQGITT